MAASGSHPLTVFIGNNGSGKSSIIEGLETFQAIVEQSLDKAMQQWRGFEHIWHKRVTHSLQEKEEMRPFHANPISFDLRGRPHQTGSDFWFEEVEDVLESPGEDRPGRDGSRVALGQTRGGRFLRVIYVRNPQPDSVFVITAYDLRGKPLLAYRRRLRKKGR